ncbi:GGDEF domain-containing protein [Halomonas denitrificans]|uniref:diguanylate cyclase n=1 Tax=Halomonas TaxID=2745 RepID=UPI001C94AD91|nr:MULTISPECIES: diguanylate cyclase [Halomonas]MBY5925654.1 GGDEF domain-containing protein [Halomonas sp. DP4Y7-2]MBY5930636.1 GGDEF domain-containing protein [Halomonas sp. DP8Y7-3]MBY5969308.1 GGDEF domain-containing protein [Halomonas denitrificans]MBY5984935.1 GGDEF domain-containing protein [Halomonas sp. DP5Y7-2]MBY6030621.1 GGDEF domain-containing protein [Halomonas sp. DP8Y7-1]
MTERDRQLLRDIEEMLASPEYAENPLRAPLEALYLRHTDQLERLERMAAISDGFQRGVKSDLTTAERRLERQQRRQRKLSRIADGYQELLFERNQTLESEVMLDPLTKIPNRRGLHTELRRLMAANRRQQRPFTLAMVDIDHFKRFNDDHGHDVGDQALLTVARVLSDTLRGGDIVGRWGGEEFLLALPGASLWAAEPLFERLRGNLKETRLIEGSDLTVTVSIGAAEHRGDETYEQTMNRADQALLEAKRSGRDRWQAAP